MKQVPLTATTGSSGASETVRSGKRRPPRGRERVNVAAHPSLVTNEPDLTRRQLCIFRLDNPALHLSKYLLELSVRRKLPLAAASLNQVNEQFVQRIKALLKKGVLKQLQATGKASSAVGGG